MKGYSDPLVCEWCPAKVYIDGLCFDHYQEANRAVGNEIKATVEEVENEN